MLKLMDSVCANLKDDKWIMGDFDGHFSKRLRDDVPGRGP